MRPGTLVEDSRTDGHAGRWGTKPALGLRQLGNGSFASKRELTRGRISSTDRYNPKFAVVPVREPNILLFILKRLFKTPWQLNPPRAFGIIISNRDWQ